jgi:hypothetical protein
MSPDGYSLEAIEYTLFVREKILEGLADLEQGRVFSQAQVNREVEEWLESSGPEPR